MNPKIRALKAFFADRVGGGVEAALTQFSLDPQIVQAGARFIQHRQPFHRVVRKGEALGQRHQRLQEGEPFVAHRTGPPGQNVIAQHGKGVRLHGAHFHRAEHHVFLDQAPNDFGRAQRVHGRGSVAPLQHLLLRLAERDGFAAFRQK